MAIRLIGIFVIFYVCTFQSDAAEWDYSSDSGKPSKWGLYWPACNGSRQSPINIETSKVVNGSSLGDITFVNYDSTPPVVKFIVENNGHALTVSFRGFTKQNTPAIKDGGLPGTYILIGFHLHWGSNNLRGSEHTIDGESGAAEIHLVHMNEKYANVSEAVGKEDGLAVLGTIIKVGDEHGFFDDFINVTDSVEFPGNTSEVSGFPLKNILPTTKDFCRYNGSLTTPKCQESVTWTVFRASMEISQDQLNKLRSMKYIAKQNGTIQPLVDTHRPVQPLYGREVLCYGKAVVHSTPMSTAMSTAMSTEEPRSKSSNLYSGSVVNMLCIVFLALLMSG